MSIWRITDYGPVPIPGTDLKQERYLEQHLEDWIAGNPEILGEQLLVIGRQVQIPDLRDRLDLLAVDIEGNAVIIELKRGDLKNPVDIQAIRYASYVSKWKFEDFENQARNHFAGVGDADYNFNEQFESFCEAAGAEEIPNLNQDQRIIIVGTAVRDKLGSVALWLRDHGIDITVMEIQAFKDGTNVLIRPLRVVPQPVTRFRQTGRTRSETTPWTVDGKSWHLENRCGPRTREMLLKLDDIMEEHFELDGPRWNQKLYVAYRLGNYNWLRVETMASVLILNISVKAGTFSAGAIAERLGIKEFDKDETPAEKLASPSSVFIRNLSETSDRIRLRIKEEFDLDNPEFLRFLEEV